MRKTIVGIAILTSAIIGYVAVGPFITLHQIKSALETRDQERLSENIDFPTLRQNLKEQFSAMVMKEAVPDMRDNPFGGLALALAPMLINGMIDSLVTPSGLASLMEGKTPHEYTMQGRESSRIEPLNEERELSKRTLRNGPPPLSEPVNGKRDPFKEARYTYDSISKFSVWLKGDSDQRVRLVLTRDGLSWKLTNIVIPDVYKPQRIESNEKSAVGSLRTINIAEITYASTYDLGYSATLSYLGSSTSGNTNSHAAGLIDSDLETGTKDGYRFTYVPGQYDPQEGQIRAYSLRADPIRPGDTGNSHYFTDESGIIRVDLQKEADANSLPLSASTQ